MITFALLLLLGLVGHYHIAGDGEVPYLSYVYLHHLGHSLVCSLRYVCLSLHVSLFLHVRLQPSLELWSVVQWSVDSYFRLTGAIVVWNAFDGLPASGPILYMCKINVLVLH